MIDSTKKTTEFTNQKHEQWKRCTENWKNLSFQKSILNNVLQTCSFFLLKKMQFTHMNESAYSVIHRLFGFANS